MDDRQRLTSSGGYGRGKRHLLGSLALAIALSAAAANPSVRFEVFTATDLTVPESMSPGSTETPASMVVEVYRIDGIEQIEATLSRGLPGDPEAARHTALARIGALDKAAMARARRAAVGLARATQYGIDRYPAIVFDGQVVVYGVTDIQEALRLYREWQAAAIP